jgi:hypothetical protein
LLEFCVCFAMNFMQMHLFYQILKLSLSAAITSSFPQISEVFLALCWINFQVLSVLLWRVFTMMKLS